MMGSTSQSVNTGMGKPASGQTSRELRHDGQHGNKHSGLESVGATR